VNLLSPRPERSGSHALRERPARWLKRPLRQMSREAGRTLNTCETVRRGSMCDRLAPPESVMFPDVWQIGSPFRDHEGNSEPGRVGLACGAQERYLSEASWCDARRGETAGRRVWPPRVGREAAGLYMSVITGMILVPWLALVSIPLIVAGALAHLPAVWGAGIALFAVQAALVARLASTYKRFLRSAGETLHLSLGWFDAPPPRRRAIRCLVSQERHPALLRSNDLSCAEYDRLCWAGGRPGR
jgi:hypothetical protein